MGESRQELLAWMNNLLQLNVTKVEQCGTGAALCQVFDSIYLDVPMTRVKFNVQTEYAYLQNFKVLQNSFVRHNVDRPINVEQLVKCKMQDNLEFLQWTKRYWDQYYPGGDYDAVGRRKASGPPTGNLPSSAASRTMTSARARGTTPTTSGPRAGAPRSGMGMGMGMGMGIGMGGSGAGGSGAGGAGGSGSSSVALARDNDALKENVAGLEKERDFYFSKLRDIELLVQKEMDDRPELDADEGSMAKQIQTILYSTEEGFEIPQEGEAAGEVAPDEMETF